MEKIEKRMRGIQQTNTYIRLIKGTLREGQRYQQRHQKDVKDVILMSLVSLKMTLTDFTPSSVSIVKLNK